MSREQDPISDFHPESSRARNAELAKLYAEAEPCPGCPKCDEKRERDERLHRAAVEAESGSGSI